MAVNQQKKRAMKRLLLDMSELQKYPINNVSAEPLEEDMFEWHCNFKNGDIIYHLILFFNEKYPYESPSAEFVPYGMTYSGFATRKGSVGTQICLNIFSDFENYHREWRHQQGLGWSPGYSVQTILLNVISFLKETQPDPGWWFWKNKTSEVNINLSKSFKCEDCGHTYEKPYPPLVNVPQGTMVEQTPEPLTQIVDYMTKEKFRLQKPKSQEELFGYGLILSGPKTRRSMTTPCEFLTSGSFYSMKDAVGTVHSTSKAQLSYFLPMYIHPLHGDAIRTPIEKTMYEAVKVLPKCSPGKTPPGDALMHLLPNLMSATVVEFSKGTQHTSDNNLNGYFALHRLFLWAIDTYPEIQKKIDDRIQLFINNTKRTKYRFPHLGEWLMLLSGSSKYRWKDTANAYLEESWRRNVMWYVREDQKLGFLDTDQTYRLEQTLKRTEVSRKLLAFQVVFLDIAMPDGMSRSDIIKRYDNNLGFPTDEMVDEMKGGLKRVNNMKTYEDWFTILGLEKPPDREIFERLINSLKFAIRTNGYHWASYNEGGWRAVLDKYKPGGVKIPTFDRSGERSVDTENQESGDSVDKKLCSGKDIPRTTLKMMAGRVENVNL